MDFWTHPSICFDNALIGLEWFVISVEGSVACCAWNGYVHIRVSDSFPVPDSHLSVSY